MKWLCAAWRARRIAKRLGFKSRGVFLAELRPLLPENYPDERQRRIAYPEAWLYITPADVTRASERVKADRAAFAARLAAVEPDTDQS